MRAFWEERCLPAAVRGPVDWSAFAWLARVRGLAIGGWGLGIGFVMLETSSSVVACGAGDSAGHAVDVVGWEREIDEGVA